MCTNEDKDETRTQIEKQNAQIRLQDTFICHVFHCEPTAGPLCKTIEAACKLR